MWDTTEKEHYKRCRIWVVHPNIDKEFRAIADKWYKQRESGEIKSDNFQLHPPRNLDKNTFTNTCGNLEYPLLFEARLISDKYQLTTYENKVLINGACKKSEN